MKYIISAIIALALILGISLKTPSTIKQQEIRKEYVKMIDTLKIYDTTKAKIKIVYKNKIDTIYASTPDKIDSLFDSTFTRDSDDTTKYVAGISQFKKALVAQNNYIKDSILTDIADTQISTCTTATNRIITKVDTVLAEDNKKYAIGAGISAIITGAACLILLH